MLALPPIDILQARSIIAALPSEPDETLDHSVHGPYLRKWLIARLPDGTARYAHQFLRSDADDELHDHPWDNDTLVVTDGYWNVSPKGRIWLGAGDRLHRAAGDFHRVQLEPGLLPFTIFDHGPKINIWGFLGADGSKIRPEDFTAGTGAIRR